MISWFRRRTPRLGYCKIANNDLQCQISRDGLANSVVEKKKRELSLKPDKSASTSVRDGGRRGQGHACIKKWWARGNLILKILILSEKKLIAASSSTLVAWRTDTSTARHTEGGCQSFSFDDRLCLRFFYSFHVGDVFVIATLLVRDSVSKWRRARMYVRAHGEKN